MPNIKAFQHSLLKNNPWKKDNHDSSRKQEIERCHRQRMVSPRALPDTEICTKTLTWEDFQKYPIPPPPQLLMERH